MKKRKSLWWVWLLVGLAVLFGLFFFILIIVAVAHSDTLQGGNVALIRVNGVIMVDGGGFGSDATSSRDVVRYIHEADENSRVKAILLDINSPGGSAVASYEIAHALQETDKPTAALIREVGASGGYWVASAADHVVANSMSITGSIGVISSYLEFSGLMEKYGVSYERLVAGEKKDIGTPLRELTPSERALLQKKLDTIHEIFIENVAKNRNLPEQEVRRLGTGEAFLGVEAREAGLIDELGGMNEAENYLFSVTDLKNIDYITYQREPTFFDLLSGVMTTSSFAIGEGIGSALVGQDLQIMAR